MPLRGGDHHVTTYVNELEARIEALEKAIGKVPKSAITASAAEKIVEAKVEEVLESKDFGATSKDRR